MREIVKTKASRPRSDFPTGIPNFKSNILAIISVPPVVPPYLKTIPMPKPEKSPAKTPAIKRSCSKFNWFIIGMCNQNDKKKG